MKFCGQNSCHKVYIKMWYSKHISINTHKKYILFKLNPLNNQLKLQSPLKSSQVFGFPAHLPLKEVDNSNPSILDDSSHSSTPPPAAAKICANIVTDKQRKIRRLIHRWSVECKMGYKFTNIWSSISVNVLH